MMAKSLKFFIRSLFQNQWWPLAYIATSAATNRSVYKMRVPRPIWALYIIVVAGPVLAVQPSSAVLPRVRIDSHYVTPTGATFAVHSGGNLQAAIDAAVPGDQIVVDAGITLNGFVSLHANGSSCGPSGNGQMVTIRTSD